MTLEEAIGKMRDNIAKSHSNAEYSALSSFDKLVEQLQLFGSQINEMDGLAGRAKDMAEKAARKYERNN